MIEPPVLPEGKTGVYWVLMGKQLWRCAPEQLRMATEQEVTVEALTKGQTLATPITELLKNLVSCVDVAKEAGHPPVGDGLPDAPDLDEDEMESDPGEAQPEEEWRDSLRQAVDKWEQRLQQLRAGRRKSRSRSQERKLSVEEQVRRWTQLESINKNRKKEGLPPYLKLPRTTRKKVDLMFGNLMNRGWCSATTTSTGRQSAARLALQISPCQRDSLEKETASGDLLEERLGATGSRPRNHMKRYQGTGF